MNPGEATLRHLLRPWEAHLAHPDTTELVVNDIGRIGVESAGVWHWHDDPGMTFERLQAICILAAWMTGKHVGKDAPTCVTKLPDGHRVKLVLPPAVPDGTVSLSIRRRALSFTPTLEWLKAHDYFAALPADRDWPAYFAREVIDRRRTVVISGEIGSSKTTFGEALLRAIPHSARVVTIEGSPEWQNLPHPNWQPFYFNEAVPGDATKRVQDAMQARADWLPFQELRGDEAWSFMRALMIGTPGITTVHAPTARRALNSILLMVMQSGVAMPEPQVRALLREYIPVIVQCARFMPSRDGERTRYRLTEVLEVGATEAEDRLVSANEEMAHA